MERPTIFLSSTIYDFRDLRSSLKDYLEQRGCRVLASEFNDFTKPLDKHSYEACLDTIEQADLFTLLIGSRVGGWTDEVNKISITRSEYRRACEHAKAGKLRLLIFVRSDVWNHRESVKRLRNHLKADAALTEERKSAIANYHNGFMTDAEAIISFIDEVSRNRETTAATKGISEAPIANWIHQFTRFTDIRETVDPLILRGLTTNFAAGRKALQSQLLMMLRGLLSKTSKGGLVYAPNIVLELTKAINLQAGTIGQKIRLSGHTWTQLVFLSTLALRAKADHTPLLPALNSDLLLSYNPVTSQFEQTAEYDALTLVVEHAKSFEKSTNSFNELLSHGKVIDQNKTRAVPSLLLATQLHRLLRWIDIIGSARALARALEGYPLKLPRPMPHSAFLDQEAQIQKEEVSLRDVRDFVSIPQVEIQ